MDSWNVLILQAIVGLHIVGILAVGIVYMRSQNNQQESKSKKD